MSHLSRKLAFSILLLASFAAMPAVYASEDATLLKAADITFHPCTWLSKRSHDYASSWRLSKAEPYTLRFKFLMDSLYHPIGIQQMKK